MQSINSNELTGHLQLIEKATKQFAKGTEGKSQEQFEAEIEAIKHLLDYAKTLFPAQQQNFIEIPARFSCF
jgi:hypothetical protein